MTEAYRNISKAAACFPAVIALVAVVPSLIAVGCTSRSVFPEEQVVTIGPYLYGGDLPPVVRSTFEFRNTSESVVDVVGVSTSCGCLRATVTPTVVDPGDSIPIEVEYRPRQIGKSVDTVQLAVLGRNGVVGRFLVQCVAYPRLEVVPKNLSLGHIPLGVKVQDEIVLRFRAKRGESHPLEVISVLTEGTGLAVEDNGWEQKGRDGPFRVWERRLRVRPLTTKQPGAASATLVLTLDRLVSLSRHDPQSREVRVSVGWNVLPIARVQPEAVVLRPGGSAAVQLVPAVRKPLRVVAHRVDPPIAGLEVQFPPKRLLPMNVEVRWAPKDSSRPEHQVTTVVFELSHPVQKSVHLTVLLHTGGQKR